MDSGEVLIFDIRAHESMRPLPKPNIHVASFLHRSDESVNVESSRTELDSHANVAVVGGHAHVAAKSSRTWHRMPCMCPPWTMT